MKIKGHVIRINHASYKRLKEFKGEQSFSQTIDALVYLGEKFQAGDQRYAVQDKLFHDVADARGFSIQVAIRDKTEPELPEIYLNIGKDKGE